MRLIPTLIVCLLFAFAGVNALAANEIDAPTVISPGQTATLKWYFGGVKLTISGGQFAVGTVITGRQSLKVSPKKTTTYLFDLYYHPGVAVEAQKTDTGKLVHVQYKATIEVLSGTQPGMLSYKGSHGWRVNYQTGWKAMPNREGSDDLIYFQQEEDAVERLAVAVVPVKNKTALQLLEEVRSDIPSNYTHYEMQSQTEFTHQSLPAVLATFTGNGQAHPDTRTTSMLMVLVNGDMGYVISVRTHADRLKLRQSVLDKILHSFTLTNKIIPVQTAAKTDTEASTTSTTAKSSENKTRTD